MTNLTKWKAAVMTWLVSFILGFLLLWMGHITVGISVLLMSAAAMFLTMKWT